MPSSLASAASAASPVPAPRLHVLVEEEAAAAAAAEEGRDVLSPLPTTGGSNGRSSLSRAAGRAQKQKQKRGRQTTTSQNHHHHQQRQMKVVARIRPLSAAEVAGGCTESVVPIVPAAAADDDVGGGGGTTSLLAGGNVGSGSNSGGSKSPSAAAAAVPKRFDYDAVLPSSADQRAVYERSVGDAVRRNVFRGYSTTIIAYGQTASGKTYTMNGPAAAEAPGDDSAGNRRRQSSLSRAAAALNESDGILPRAVHDLFEARRAGQREAKIHLSYLEIYNDAIRDLLGGDDDNGRGGGGGGGGGDGANLPLLDDGHGVSVRGLSSIEVRTAGEARELMDLASLRRTTGVSGEAVWCAYHVSSPLTIALILTLCM